jgi:CDP-diacylglycerol---serine O-phosphatidyltransferase
MASDTPLRRIRVPLRRRTDVARRKFRRGVYIIPSLFTLANMFCGYACIIYAIRGEYETAAPFIGFAIVLDLLDGRIARMTGTSSEFGLQFDSLADVISFGVAPAILAFTWGLGSLGRLGWAAAFLFVTAAALRLARFNIQTGSVDKRYFVGMPSPAAAGVPAATVFAYPWGLHDAREALPALLMVVVPALLMVSTIRFRSFKTFDLQSRRPFRVLILFAAFIILVATRPQIVLVVLAYTYLLSAFIGLAWSRLRRRPGTAAAGTSSAEEQLEPPP